MAKNIFVSSSTGFSGKTAIIFGMAMYMTKELNLKVGYFKPFGKAEPQTAAESATPMDEDALTIKAGLDLPEPLPKICPVLLSTTFLESLCDEGSENVWKKIQQAYEEVAKNKDIVFIEGTPTPPIGSFLDLDGPTLAKKFNAKIVLISKPKNEEVLDELYGAITYYQARGAEITAVILNGVSRPMMKVVSTVMKPTVEEYGVPVLGVIPEERSLGFPTVAEVIEEMGGQLLAGEDQIYDLAIEHFLVGAMGYEGALKFFRRFLSKCVITGGDRGEIALGAMTTSTSLIILTGNFYPDIRVITEAREREIPLLLVPYHTMEVIQRLTLQLWRFKPQSEERVALLQSILNKNLNWESFKEKFL